MHPCQRALIKIHPETEFFSGTRFHIFKGLIYREDVLIKYFIATTSCLLMHGCQYKLTIGKEIATYPPVWAVQTKVNR